jgi:hypothetical protein
LTIQDLGSLGELVAAVATVATLGYLAVQIRQNTRAIHASALQAANDSAQRVLATASQNPENAEIYHRGLASYSDLTPAQQTHFTIILLGIFSASEAMYWNHRNHLLPEEIWDREVKVLRLYLGTSGGQAMWRGTGALFSDSFAQFVDAELEQLKPSSTPAA